MTRDGGTTRHRAVTPARVITAVGAVLVAAGVALFLLPYDADLDLATPSGVLSLEGVPDQVRCEAPLLDAFHGEPDGWIDYAPDSGTTVAEGDVLTGTWCHPESMWRGIGGLVLVLAGIVALLLSRIVARRRASGPPDATAAEGPADPGEAGAAPIGSRIEGAEPAPGPPVPPAS